MPQVIIYWSFARFRILKLFIAIDSDTKKSHKIGDGLSVIYTAFWTLEFTKLVYASEAISPVVVVIL